MISNLTNFFRETHHFEHVPREVLPGMMQSRRAARGRIRI
jgi:chemotaxis protein methyltransferase CheR